MKPIDAWSHDGSTHITPRAATLFLVTFCTLVCSFCLAPLTVPAKAAVVNPSAPLILPLKINAPQATVAELTGEADRALTSLAADREFTTIARDAAAQAINYTSNWPPSLSTLKTFAGTRDAEYIIIGTLNQLGDRVSIDLTVFDLLEENPPKYFFKDGATAKGLNNLLHSLGEDVLAYTGRHFRYADITVSGNKRIDSGAILNKIISKVGNRYDPAKLDQDLRRVFQMGYFNDVRIEREETDSGIKINFAVTEKEVVGVVSVRGEDKIESKEVKEVITVTPNNIINPKELRASVDNIKKLYKDKGFYRTEVTSKLTHPTADRVNVTFTIKEGFKAYIKDIIISGNEAFSDKEIRKVMMTSERGFLSWFTDTGILKRDMIEQDAARINAFYNNHGYIDVKVGQPEIDQKEKSIFITIPLAEGKRYMVGELDAVGDLIERKGTILAQTKLGNERFFNRETLHNDVLAITDYYAEKGFAYAEVNPEIIKDPVNQRVNTTFTINKGPLVHINRIIVKGNDRTRDKVIRREMKIKEGAIFDATGIKKSQERLQRLEFFEEVTVTPHPTADEKIMDVDVEVKEKATGTFSLGAGYSTVDSLMFMGEVSQNNFRGLGQQLTLQANLSGSSSRYNFSFTEPHLNDSPLLFGFDLYNWSREYDDYTRTANGFGLRFGYPIWNKWKLFWGYGWDDTKLTDIQPTTSQLILDSQNINTTSSVRVGVSRDTRDKRYGATKGSRHTISSKYAGGPLGGDAEFTKVEASTSWYFPWLWDTVYHWKLAGGQIFDNGNLPVFERFYLGGLNSIRGFKNGQISPRDAATDAKIGGTKMWYTNYEYIFPLVKDAGLNGLIFFDAGNVFDSDENWGENTIKRSIGYGFRWMSPMGPLRLEWGLNLDPLPNESTSTWDFSIGGTF